MQKMSEAGMQLQMEKVELQKQMYLQNEANMNFKEQIEAFQTHMQEFEMLKTTLKWVIMADLYRDTKEELDALKAIDEQNSKISS